MFPEKELNEIVSAAVAQALKKAGVAPASKPSGNLPEQMISKHQVMAMVGISSSTLWRWCEAGKFPQPYKIVKSRRWKLSEVETWLADRCAELDRERGE